MACPEEASRSLRAFRVNLLENGTRTKEFIIYPDHSPAGILHDYTKACGLKLRYEYGGVEGGQAVTVFVENVAHAVGRGTSKMAAKQDAAKQCLKILIPHIKEYWPDDTSSQGTDLLLEFGDASLKGMDVMSLCKKLNEPFPLKCLETCLMRNFGFRELDKTQLETSVTPHNGGFKCTLAIMDVTGVGTAESQKMAVEMAAHSMLMALHPAAQDFGAILQLYGKRSSISRYLERSREESKKVTELGSAFRDNKGVARVNLELLAKLREEMRKCPKNTRK